MIAQELEAIDVTITNNLTATGRIHADNEVTAPGVGATLFSGGSFKGSNVEAGFITAENWIKTPALQVNGTQVLTQTVSDSNQSISVIYSDGGTGTLTAQVHSKVSNINNEQHVLTCQLPISNLTYSIKELIIPTGLALQELTSHKLQEQQ